MSSSIFGAEQRISEPLSALAVLTGRHRGKKTPATLSPKSTSQRNQRVNDRASGLLMQKKSYINFIYIFVGDYERSEKVRTGFVRNGKQV